MAGPCTPWVTPADLLARPGMFDAIVDTGVLFRAVAFASNLLWMLSGRQYSGVCTATIRPAAALYGCGGVYPLQAAAARGMTIDSWMAATNGGACCPAGLRIGLYPVRAITQVKIDGVVQNPTGYRLDDNRWLVRIGSAIWPVTQRLELPDTAAGTFSVTLTYGADPPPAGVLAAGVLGAEVAKAESGLTTNLPQRVTRMARQQVTIEALSPQAFLKDGLTGIYLVDAFIVAANPARQTRPATVWSPDVPGHRRTG